jgi:D-tyrosyl-tRNA(Tyr) deacylase
MNEMIAVIQRVLNAKVEIEGRIAGEIGRGILVLLGVEKSDGMDEAVYCARKTAELRIFPDNENKMNLSLLDIKGEALVVSQFTLPAKIEKGRRPSFDNAMPGKPAEDLYREFVEEMRKLGIKTETGEFGAMMNVNLVNDGPVTFILESRNRG